MSSWSNLIQQQADALMMPFGRSSIHPSELLFPASGGLHLQKETFGLGSLDSFPK
jgi:hypothetical protein